MLAHLRQRTTGAADARRDPAPGSAERLRRSSASSRRWPAHHIDASTGEDEIGGIDCDPNDPASWGEVGRNEPCPCGSGKKFKHCHGAYVVEA